MKEKYNYNISIIRVLAMISIIIGHWCNWRGINLYQFGGIGVEIFLFISGFLYTNKNISKPLQWFGGRFRRLFPEIWVVTCIVAILDWKLYRLQVILPKIIVHILGLSGTNFILGKVVLPGFEELGPLWFITVIFVCYYLLILVKKKDPLIKEIVCEHPYLVGISTILVMTILNYFSIQIGYFLQFFTGYVCGWEHYDDKSLRKKWCILTITSFIAGGFRIISNRYIDGTVLYDSVIAILSFNIISIWIIVTISLTLRAFKNLTKRIVESNIWKHIDKLSYPLFVTHYIFLQGSHSLDKYVENSVIQNNLFVIFTVLLSEMVMIISDKLRIFIAENNNIGK